MYTANVCMSFMLCFPPIADREVQRILLELLNQMDGFDQNVNMKVCTCSVHVFVYMCQSTEVNTVGKYIQCSYVWQSRIVYCECIIEFDVLKLH